MEFKISDVKAVICILLILSIVTVFAASSQLTVKALEPEIAAYIEPSSIVFSPENATLGQLFNVTVWINSTGSFNLMMWQVFLSFDDSIITYVRAWPNMNDPNWDPEYIFYNQGGQAVNPIFYTAQDSPIGLPGVMMGHTILGDLNVTEFPKKLCAVEFNITKVEDGLPFTCVLGINNDQTFFYNSTGAISVTLIDGNYNYIPEFTLVGLLSLMLIASTVLVVGTKIRTPKRKSSIEK